MAAALFVSGSAFSQFTLTIENTTSCMYELLIIEGTCPGPTGRQNTIVHPGTNTYTIPNDVRRARFIGCCGGSTGTATISFQCGPQINSTGIDCGTDDVIFNFVQQNLVEISI